MTKEKIEKSKGSTPSERHLAQLAEKSFLDLWSYSNVFNEQKKELCDLLVVCGDYILIFSDKTKKWSDDRDTILAWKRWYRKAIKASIKQIEGAVRWIEQSPDKLFLDSACSRPFPHLLPAPPQRKIINIIVANGSKEANRRILGEKSGSLLLMPRIKGDEHLDGYLETPCIPFAIGDVNPDGAFMHVLDEVALQIVMEELDTITDFVQYFEKREKFIRSNKLISAFGEEDLLAYYLSNINENEEHDFTISDEKEERVVIPGDFYNMWKVSRPYQAKVKANQISYIWDKTIGYYTKIYKADTYDTLSGDKLSMQQIELALRTMAMESRIKRRMLGSELIDALKEGSNIDSASRLVLFTPNDNEATYLFLTLKYPKDFKPEGGYAQYRRVRMHRLYGNCLAALRKHPEIKTIIGFATEPLSEDSQCATVDLLWLNQPEWTAEHNNELEIYSAVYNINISNKKELTQMPIYTDEYPI